MPLHVTYCQKLIILITMGGLIGCTLRVPFAARRP
jgi:hypothetical protein